jgi:hypothetical protein
MARLLRGARAISRHLFGDEEDEHVRDVYSLAPHLPLFKMGGVWHGRPETLDAALTERERTSQAAQENEEG